MQVARASGLAHWLVARSTLHPLQRDVPVMHEMSLGGNKTALMFERHTARLCQAAYMKALKIAWYALSLFTILQEHPVSQYGEHRENESGLDIFAATLMLKLFALLRCQQCDIHLLLRVRTQ